MTFLTSRCGLQVARIVWLWRGGFVVVWQRINSWYLPSYTRETVAFLPWQHCHCLWICFIAFFSLAEQFFTYAQIPMSLARHRIISTNTNTRDHLPLACLKLEKCGHTFHRTHKLDVATPFITNMSKMWPHLSSHTWARCGHTFHCTHEQDVATPFITHMS